MTDRFGYDHYGFVQIAADDSILYALDAGGKVWMYRSTSDDWLQLGVGRAPFVGPGIERLGETVTE